MINELAPRWTSRLATANALIRAFAKVGASEMTRSNNAIDFSGRASSSCSDPQLKSHCLTRIAGEHALMENAWSPMSVREITSDVLQRLNCQDYHSG